MRGITWVRTTVGADSNNRRAGIFAVGASDVPRSTFSIHCGETLVSEASVNYQCRLQTGMCRSIRMQSNSEVPAG